MNELQRMQYLEALGVETFVPRWVLPGARPSRQCSLPAVDASPAVPLDSASANDAPAPQQKAQPAGALVDSLLQRTPEPPSQRAAEVTPKPRVHTEQAAFSLSFWRVHPDVMVVDSRQAKALPTAGLLQAILLANGLSNRLPRVEVQSWPMPGSGDNSWPAAREMIQAFLESRLLSEPVRFLLIMGSDAAQAVMGTPDLPDTPVPLDSFACEALLTPSLAELLLQPTLKQTLWRRLAPLRHLVHEKP